MLYILMTFKFKEGKDDEVRIKKDDVWNIIFNSYEFKEEVMKVQKESGWSINQATEDVFSHWKSLGLSAFTGFYIRSDGQIGVDRR